MRFVQICVTKERAPRSLPLSRPFPSEGRRSNYGNCREVSMHMWGRESDCTRALSKRSRFCGQLRRKASPHRTFGFGAWLNMADMVVALVKIQFLLLRETHSISSRGGRLTRGFWSIRLSVGHTEFLELRKATQ